MKITQVEVFEVNGVMEFEGDFWEERLIRPIDIYPEFKAQKGISHSRNEEGVYPIRTCFCRIHTDEGVTGLAGPFGRDQAFIIQTQLSSLLIDQNPLAIERIWDQMYRSQIHGRKGVAMQAISVVDCALWDLKGKWFDVPVYVLLGGATRESVPAYASTLGYSLDEDKVQQRVQEFMDQGYRAMKWFFRDGPDDGHRGIDRNLTLVETIRESAGPDVDIMLDAWNSWDVPYTIEMAQLLEPYYPEWIEEPVLADKIDQYAELTRTIHSTKIAGGEHEYTRWGIKALLDARAVDVLQPDIYWAGGISEVNKICALASAYDIPVIPHGHSTHATINLITAWPQPTCPRIEFLIKWNAIHQHFLAHPLRPYNGEVWVPNWPGLGMELDESKIVSMKHLDFTG